MVLPFKGALYDNLSYFHQQIPTAEGRRAPCSQFELNSVECLEAYGMVKGSQECAQFLEDLRECRFGHYRMARKILLQAENYKQVVTGKIPFKERHGKPLPYDSYICGTFYP